MDTERNVTVHQERNSYSSSNIFLDQTGFPPSLLRDKAYDLPKTVETILLVSLFLKLFLFPTYVYDISRKAIGLFKIKIKIMLANIMQYVLKKSLK